MNFIKYKEHISDLCEKIEMPAEYAAAALDCCEKICESETLYEKFLEIQENYFNGGAFEYNVTPVTELAEANGFEKYMFTLTFCLMYSLQTLEIYKRREYPMDVYYDSFRDLVIWGNVCLNAHGIFGIDNYGWVSEQIRGRLFRIGRLQFHYIEHNGPEHTHAGVTVRKGQRVINIHIPEGDALTREKRMDSYRRAYRFFGQTGNAVFECESWLLYEKGREFINPDSNIIDFMNDFQIIHTDEKQGEFGEAWRVFGFLESYDPASLPRNTSLQRAYADRLISGGATGNSLGIMIFDGENIL